VTTFTTRFRSVDSPTQEIPRGAVARRPTAFITAMSCGIGGLIGFAIVFGADANGPDVPLWLSVPGCVLCAAAWIVVGAITARDAITRIRAAAATRREAADARTTALVQDVVRAEVTPILDLLNALPAHMAAQLAPAIIQYGDERSTAACVSVLSNTGTDGRVSRGSASMRLLRQPVGVD
jgi:hypothetical protein